MSMTPDSASYFKKVADQWDSLRSGYFTTAVREAAIQRAGLQPYMVVADIGAGTGFMAAGLAPLVSHVHVVDGSAAMLEVARRNLEEFSNVSYHESDGLALPFPDASLEAVFANMYLHHTLDPLAAIREMVRILRPGGKLLITDMDSHPYTWLKEEMADVWMGFEREQVRQWFETAGLVDVAVDCTGQTCNAESGNTAVEAADRQAAISVFVACGTRLPASERRV